MRYWRPWRRVVLTVYSGMAWLGWRYAGDALLDYLYPDDCVVTFGKGEGT